MKTPPVCIAALLLSVLPAAAPAWTVPTGLRYINDKDFGGMKPTINAYSECAYYNRSGIEDRRDLIGNDSTLVYNSGYREITFTGSKFWIRALTETTPQYAAPMKVTIDGQTPIQVYLDNSDNAVRDPRHPFPAQNNMGTVAYTSEDLPHGKHTVRIESAMQGYSVTVDALVFCDNPKGMFEFTEFGAVSAVRGTKAPIRIRRLGDCSQSAAVKVIPADGSVRAPITEQTLNFSAGEREKTLNLNLPAETPLGSFTLSLQPEEGIPSSYSMEQTVNITAGVPVRPGEDGFVHIPAEYATWSAYTDDLMTHGQAVGTATPILIEFTAERPTFTIDADVSVGSLKLCGTAGTLTSANGKKLTATDTTVSANVTVEPGAAHLGALTVEEGKTLTVRQSLNSALISKMAANTGTIQFAGGSRDNPLEYDTRWGVLYRIVGYKIRVAANSWVRGHIDANAKHLVTGEDRETSHLGILSDKEAGFESGTVFSNLTLSLLGAPDIVNTTVWLQTSTNYDNVVLELREDGNGYPFLYDDLTVKGLTGNGVFRHHSSRAGETTLTVMLDNTKDTPRICGGDLGRGGIYGTETTSLAANYRFLGTGTQIFSGINHATSGGSMQIGDGTDSPTFELNGTVKNAPVTVSKGATLRGSGIIGGSLTLAEGAILDLTEGALTVNGAVTAAKGVKLMLPENAAESETEFMKGPGIKGLNTAGLAPEGFALYAKNGSLWLKKPVPADLPAPEGSAGGTYSQTALEKILTLTEGVVPAKIEALTAKGEKLTAEKAGAVLELFDGVARSVADETGTTLKIGYSFGIVRAVPHPNGKIAFTVRLLNGSGTPAGLASGTQLQMLKNGKAVGEPTSLMENGEATFIVDLPANSDRFTVKAFR